MLVLERGVRTGTRIGPALRFAVRRASDGDRRAQAVDPVLQLFQLVEEALDPVAGDVLSRLAVVLDGLQEIPTGLGEGVGADARETFAGAVDLLLELSDV